MDPSMCLTMLNPHTSDTLNALSPSAKTPEPVGKDTNGKSRDSRGPVSARRSLEAMEMPRPPPMLSTARKDKGLTSSTPSASAKGRNSDRATVSPPALQPKRVREDGVSGVPIAALSADTATAVSTPANGPSENTEETSGVVGGPSAGSVAKVSRKRAATDNEGNPGVASKPTAQPSTATSPARRVSGNTTDEANKAAAQSSSSSASHARAVSDESHETTDGKRSHKRVKAVHFSPIDGPSADARDVDDEGAFAMHATVLRSVPAALDFMFNKIKSLEDQVALLVSRENNVKANARRSEQLVADQLHKFAAMSTALLELQTRVSGAAVFEPSQSV